MGKSSRRESRRDRHERVRPAPTPQVPPSLIRILTEEFPADVTALQWTATLRNAGPEAYIVAANVRGPGIASTDQAMWPTNSLSGTGRIYATNERAECLTGLECLSVPGF